MGWSGPHVNPAVTIALAVRGRFAWADVPGYVIAQVVGGVLAGLLAWATCGAAGARAGLGTTVVNPAASTLTALVVETLVAFLWVLAYYALVVEERVSRTAAGLGVGLAYGTAILALAPITGASATSPVPSTLNRRRNWAVARPTEASCGSTRLPRSWVASSRCTSRRADRRATADGTNGPPGQHRQDGGGKAHPGLIPAVIT